MLYPWQEPVWQNWQQLLRQGRLHHAILLVAPGGSGREALAKQLAKTVLCQQSETEPCGLCHGCQLFAAGTHPDFHAVAPVQAGKQIGVDAIRQCNRWATETSQLAGQRVIMIDPADHMGESAANALLKTLEEPPSGCQFILLAHSLDRLLPTITSRCNQWRLPTPDESQTQRWVEQQLMQSVKREAIRLNSGSPLATVAFIEQGQDIRYGKLLAAFSEFAKPPHLGLYEVAGLCTAEGSISLKWLSYFLVDCIKLQQGAGSHLIHCESVGLVQAVAGQLSPAVLLRQVHQVNALQRQLETHPGLNEELLIVNWLTGFMPA
ncbi:DNA polymerase III subunit delta' [Photobacterium atrarenae]|uniref:DNA polymerase III subunit delta' n=1 Tax=Photobacterium atrarenae TaxID=865757 RepID=A0ABY5GDJ9_9GAMM|nr:DNA polymerase III subunit delta' [Photobacterium atrarenae]UTV26784.1 DNA polymerase III subunit delta' [Photobacterium atrarenae]